MKKIIKNFSELWCRLALKRKMQFIRLIGFSVVTSFFEVLSIGAVFPFLGIISNPVSMFENAELRYYFTYAGIQQAEQLVMPAVLIFAGAAIMAGLTRTILLWNTTRFALGVCADLGAKIYLNTIYQPYQVHIARNSSKVINGITTQINSVIYEIILPLMIFISSAIIALFIIGALVFLNPILVPIIFLFFGFIYWAIGVATRKRISHNSFIIAEESSKLIKSVQEGLGSIRDIIVNGSQLTYFQSYQNSNLPLRSAQASNAFIGSCPRYAIETIGIVLISFVALYLLNSQRQTFSSTLPFLGAIALGAQRLLPLCQQLYSSWSSIRGAQDTLNDVICLLKEDDGSCNVSGKGLINFKSQIEFVDVCFKYEPSNSLILNNVNIAVSKGDMVGIVGKTGSGKSTLIDILMGLLPPSSGSIQVDQKDIWIEGIRSWQEHIAHVPQEIYLSDASVRENIAFGVPPHLIDEMRVRAVAKQACISDLIESWENGYDANIGERGVKISGGQKQRIGIARALYRNAEVIIFDEATSALDAQTEQDVMSVINNLENNLTIFIIAHRLSTLSKCNKLIELKNGLVTIAEITNLH